MQQKPSPGRIVHFVLPGGPYVGAHRAAIITSDWTSTNVNLNVQLDQSGDETGLEKTGNYTARAWSAPFDPEGRQLGSWHWPEILA